MMPKSDLTYLFFKLDGFMTNGSYYFHAKMKTPPTGQKPPLPIIEILEDVFFQKKLAQTLKLKKLFKNYLKTCFLVLCKCYSYAQSTTFYSSKCPFIVVCVFL